MNDDGEEDTSSCKQGDGSDDEDVSDSNKKVSKSNHGMSYIYFLNVSNIADTFHKYL